jgi:DNA-binding response OmpR family regulator
MNILIVEDQQRLARALAAILEEAHYNVDTVFDGQEGLDYALLGSYDAIVLDVMLPKRNGFDVVREIRRAGNSVPVIMLTARDTLRDKVAGLDLGADDYLTKPFQPAELLARLRALTRRQGAVAVEALRAGNTVLDLGTADLRVEEDDAGGAGAGDASDAAAAAPTAPAAAEPRGVHLSQREFDVCQLLMGNLGQTIPKASMLTHIWGNDGEADENSVEAYVSFLRKKLAFIGSNLHIKTLRMIGYRMELASTEPGDNDAASAPAATPAAAAAPAAR